VEGTIVLGLGRTTLFPSEDGLALDVIGLQVLNVVSLTDGLDQSAHLVGKLGDEDHGLKVRRDSAFGCCHSSKPDEDGVNGECRVGVPGDDDVHGRLEFLIGGGDAGFAVGGLEVFPCYGSEHCGDVGVFLDGLFEEVQNGRGKCWMEAEHDVPQSPVVGIEPGGNLGLVGGGLRGVCNRFGVGSFRICFGNSGRGIVFGSGELVCNDSPLTLREEVVHH